MPSVDDIVWSDVRMKNPPVASLEQVAAWEKKYKREKQGSGALCKVLEVQCPGCVTKNQDRHCKKEHNQKSRAGFGVIKRADGDLCQLQRNNK